MVTSKKVQINSYSASRKKPSPSQQTSINGQYVPNPYDAVIMCYCAEGHIVYMYFIPAEYELPANATNLDAKKGWIFLHSADYLPTIDMLRNEKPVYFRLYQEIPSANNIHTGSEIVGEGET